jgi:hypothetical protein
MISKKSKVIFLMPPKTASNSLKQSLLDSSFNFDKIETNGYPKIHLFLSEILSLSKIDIPEEYKIVQVVRNPFTRFASTYFHQLRLVGENSYLKKLSFDDFCEHFYKSINSDYFLKSFYKNIDFVNQTIRKGKNWGGTRAYLLQTQYNDRKLNVKYFKLEDISKDISQLSEYLDVYLPDMDRINENKTPKDYLSMLSDRTKSIIYEVYEKDFKYLDYGTAH